MITVIEIYREDLQERRFWRSPMPDALPLL